MNPQRIDLNLTAESLEMLADLGMLDAIAERVRLDPTEVTWVALGESDD